MIYTLTFNPAIDYVMHLDGFEKEAINRSNDENAYFGGKGLNVSYILSELGCKSTALGFVAGYVGEAIENMLAENGVICDFIKLEKGNSRINVKLRHGGETDINGNGPEIEKHHIDALFDKLAGINQNDFLIIAGSVPKNIDADIYANIAEFLKDKGVNLVVDTTGDLMLKILKYNPFLIKPNNDELGELFSTTVKTFEACAEYGRKLQEMGARNVLVSMGGEGSVLVAEDGNAYTLEATKGKLVNSVGAGDSMVAGFVAGYIEKNDYKYAHMLGSASGSATAFSPWLANKQEINSILNQIL